MEERSFDLAVIGGGPAGTAAAITAARYGARVLLLERGRVPRHKVCGEFVSPESSRLLAALLEGNEMLGRAPRISRTRLFLGGTSIAADVTPAAVAISRYELDLALWKAAERAGVECRQGIVVHAVSKDKSSGFLLRIGASGVRVGEMEPQAAFRAASVIDASGRWSNLQQERTLPAETWVGLKAHFETAETGKSVDLYFFSQGYCGVQAIGDGRVNACAMVRASARVGNSLERVFALHPELWRRSRDWSAATETIATAPLFFREPEPLRGRVLLAGDAAGFIDPFVGDGISMALRSGALAAECLARSEWSTERACPEYETSYRKEFLSVFRNAARLRKILDLPEPIQRTFGVLAHVPGVAEYVLRSTRLA